MSFNPDVPDVIGLEWQPLHEDQTLMVSALQSFAASKLATATETVDEVWLFSAVEAGRTPEPYQLDIYEEDAFPDSTVTVYTGYPSADVSVIGATTWNGSSFGTSAYYSFVNNVTQSPVTLPDGDSADDDFIFAKAGGWYTADFRFEGFPAPLTGKHIVRVRLRALIQPYAGVGQDGTMTVTPYLKLGGVPYLGTARTVSGRVAGGHEVTYDWYFNPDELRGWLPDDIDGFSIAGGTASAGWSVNPTGNGFILASILQAQMEVHFAGDDVRVGTAHLTRADQLARPAAGLAWFPMSVTQPDGTSGWDKAASQSYRLEWRRLSSAPGGLQLSMVALAGADDRPTVNGWGRVAVDYDANTRLPADATRQMVGSWAPAVALVSGGASSADSQPYVELDEDDTPVYTGHEVRQYFTTPGSLPATDFTVLRAVVGRRGATISEPLVITIHQESDDAQVGSTLTLTGDEFDALPDGELTAFATYRTVELHLTTPATLATSTQYYAKFLSASATQATGWRVEVARTDRFPSRGDTLPPSIDATTFGGTVDSLWRDGSFLPDADALVVLATEVTVPADVGVSVLPTSSDCIQFVRLDWSATSLAGAFARYEIQRQDGTDTQWEWIATISDESISEFDDYESRRGQEAGYRVRVVRADGTPSDWSPVVTATAEAPCCGYIFTSNVAPEFTLWLDDVGEERGTDTPQNAAVVQFFERDFQVVFFEMENRGDRFKRKLVVAVAGALDGTEPASIDSREIFGPLRSITRPNGDVELPYVCVHEESGNRWFASILTPSVLVRKAPGLYQADVEVIEVTSTPYAPVVES